MKRVVFATVSVLITCGLIAAAPAASFDGEYNSKRLKNGAAVFEFSVHQNGSLIDVAFDAAYADAHGATPEAAGSGKVSGANIAQFTWKDSRGNAGSGTMKLTSIGCDVSLKTTKVGDRQCLEFYNEPLALKRSGKK